ncbi:putative disease resistance RPP13-like protein 1 [Miscanthus floridulus]|uniref:putative disease resistance RPP13-like protein 1 n=1 Tax=Miscanthus floridulus TaxID=154761 RepID=UPI00345AA630
MVSLTEIFLSAILGDLTTRCIDFLARKRPNKPPVLDDVEDRLRRVLLRAQVIVDEAMGRQITNQAMLRQLDALTDTVHRGYYTLDTFRSFQQAEKEEPRPSSNGQTTIVSHRLSSHFSRVDPCLSILTSRAVHISKEMQEVLDTLSAMIVDAHELVLFLANYGHRMYRQPYSMHLLLGNCMFGRQMEAQYVIDFLLHTQPPGGVKEPVEVLPIVGPCAVGKSTLVAHVCKDERVRDHFAETVFLSDQDFAYDGLAAFREGLSAKNRTSSDHGTRRMLLVVEVAGIDLDEDVWNMLYSASKHWMPMGSKIILTSRSVKVAELGTTQALTLKPLSHEAYWYFFRTLAFGSTDPTSSHPRFINLAMETVTVLNDMIIANVIARMMRDSFGIHFWGKLAAFVRLQFQKHVFRFGGHPYDLVNQNKTLYFGRMRSEQVVCYHPYRHSSQKEVPKITLHEVINGDAELPAGRFQVLAWSSQIQPYYSYIYDCEILELKSTGNKRKRSAKNGGPPSICL